jgi:signal transduction histidine kinase
VQEALANVRRHSGARRARLQVERDGADVVLEVHDDGKGFPPQPCREAGTVRSSFGLEIMRERAESIGARLSYGNAPGGGAKVTIRVPAGESPMTEKTNG